MTTLSDDQLQAELDAIQPQHNIILQTDRLVLRPVRISDITRLHQIRRKPEVMTFMHTGAEPEVNPLRCFSFDRMKMMTAPGFFSFAIELKPDTDVIAGEDAGEHVDRGTELIGFTGITRPTEIFYIFDSPYWGKGYASESLKAFLPAYWANFPAAVPGTPPDECDALLAWVADGNRSSENVALKAGFELLVQGIKDGEEEAAFVVFRPGCVGRDELLQKLRRSTGAKLEVIR